MRFIKLAVFSVLIFISSSSKAQKEGINNEKFGIAINILPQSLILNCKSGCAWESMEIESEYGEIKLINQFGVYSIGSQANTNTLESSSAFVFFLDQSKNSLRLKSLRGTYWEELTFLLSKDETGFLTKQGIRVESAL